MEVAPHRGGDLGLSMLVDRYGRAITYLRISVTDRCNFRCTYCMPREAFGKDFQFLPREALLTFEEIARVAKIFAGRWARCSAPVTIRTSPGGC